MRWWGVRDVVKVPRMLAVTGRDCLFARFSFVAQILPSPATDFVPDYSTSDNTFPASRLPASCLNHRPGRAAS